MTAELLRVAVGCLAIGAVAGAGFALYFRHPLAALLAAHREDRA